MPRRPSPSIETGGAALPRPHRLLRGAVLLPIRGYQLFLSPILGQNCRFAPTCSAYAVEAVGRHGIVAGGRLAIRRLARCHPWGGSGYDPVPDRT